MKLELYQYADVSTAHISREDDEELRDDACVMDERSDMALEWLTKVQVGALIVFAYDTGYWVHTEVASCPETLKKLRSRYSKELLRLICWASSQGASFLRLDAGGTIYNNLKKFSW